MARVTVTDREIALRSVSGSGTLRRVAITDWFSRLLRPGPTFECHLGWGNFPPVPKNAPEADFERYLEGCRFDSAVVDADNQLTITLLDPDRQVWTFRFPNAGLSVSPWPEGTLSQDWDSGIYYLDTAISRARDGSISYSYELESRVSLVVQSLPVQVASP